jgi:hypothetical protein
LAISSVPAAAPPADDQQFRGLQQHANIAVLHQVAAHDGANYDNDADDHEHGKPNSLTSRA